MTDTPMTATPASPARAPWRAFAVLALGITAVSFAAVLIRQALASGLPATVVAGGRLVLATAVLSPYVLARHRATLAGLRHRDVALMGLSGAFLALHFYTWVSSLGMASVLLSGTLVSTTPLWTALIERLLLGRRLPLGAVVGIGLALVGGTLIALPDPTATSRALADNALLGGTLATVGAATAAAYFIVGHSLRATIPLPVYLWCVYGVAGLLLSMAALGTGASLEALAGWGGLWVVLLTLGPQLTGHSALNYALAHLSPTYVTLATKVELVASVVLAYWLFGEQPGTWQLVGGMVVLAGVIAASVRLPPMLRAWGRLRPHPN